MSYPFDPDRRSPEPLLVLLSDTHIIVVRVFFRVAVFYEMFECIAALRHRPVEKDGFRQPAAHKMAAGSLEQLSEGMAEPSAVEFGDNVPVQGHFDFKDHSLGGRSGSVGVHCGVKFQLSPCPGNGYYFLHVGVEFRLAFLW